MCGNMWSLESAEEFPPCWITGKAISAQEMLWDTYHIFDPYDDGPAPGDTSDTSVAVTNSWVKFELSGSAEMFSNKGKKTCHV